MRNTIALAWKRRECGSPLHIGICGVELNRKRRRMVGWCGKGVLYSSFFSLAASSSREITAPFFRPLVISMFSSLVLPSLTSRRVGFASASSVSTSQT